MTFQATHQDEPLKANTTAMGAEAVDTQTAPATDAVNSKASLKPAEADAAASMSKGDCRLSPRWACTSPWCLGPAASPVRAKLSTR